MKRHLFTKVAFALALVGMGVEAQAQVAPPMTSGNIKNNIINARFKVNTPATVAGLKKVTVAPWGANGTGVPSAPMFNIPVARGLDTLAANPLTNAAAVAGKFCLLYRGGGVTFRQKADYAKNAGAVGLIIVNNIPGDPVGMGNTGTGNVTIPVLMVSDIEGNAIAQQLRNNVAVTVTLGPWGLGATHDLGIVNGYQATPHALNIPLSQFAKSNNLVQYKNWLGGAVANFGTATESNITVTDSLMWTPTGGSPSFVSTHSYSIASIAPADSIKFGFGTAANSYYITPPATTGRYDYKYRISYGQTDEVPEDNVYTMSMYITDSIFCKSNYDYTKGEPHVSQGIQPASASNPFLMGPMFFMTTGGYAARKMQFYLSKNGSSILDGSEAFALVYKWVDGSNGQALDSLVVGDELTLVGQTYRKFSAADSGGKVYTLTVDNPVNASKPVVLDSNSWYWVCVQSPSDCYIGVDQSVSYFTRSYAQSQLTGYQDFPEGAFYNDQTVLTGNTLVYNFPFGGNSIYIDSTFYDRYYEIPAVALLMSKDKANVGVGHTAPSVGQLNLYPNPANNQIDVDLDLVKQSGNVGLRLLDVVGRVVYTADYSNVKKDHFTISTGSLPTGTYHLFVTTDTGYLSRKVIVQR